MSSSAPHQLGNLSLEAPVVLYKIMLYYTDVKVLMAVIMMGSVIYADLSSGFVVSEQTQHVSVDSPDFYFYIHIAFFLPLLLGCQVSCVRCEHPASFTCLSVSQECVDQTFIITVFSWHV